MDHEKGTLSVTAPPPGATVVEQHYDEKKVVGVGSSEIMFDKMSSVEKSEYNIEESANESSSTTQTTKKISLFAKNRLYILPAMWLLFTGFLIAAYVLQIPKGYNQELLILGLIYLYFTLYVFFCFVPTTIVTKPWNYAVNVTAEIICARLSPRVRTIVWATFVFAVIVITVFSFPESTDSPRLRRLISLLGLLIFIGGLYACSAHRRHVPWNTVSTAILIQFILALFVFRSQAGQDIFNWCSTFAEGYLGNAWYGADFVFGDAAANSGVFAISVFPAVIFFASTVQMLYYIGAIQFILKKLSVVFISILGISGAESVVAIASPFLGQSENALLIEPLIPHLTKSEIHQIMTCGFATISGSTLYGYISMGVSGQALLTSCIMSIPCSIAVSKLRYPESEQSLVQNINEISAHEAKDTTNILHAAGKGAEVGIRIVFLIMANLISILAILYAVNAFLTWLGNFITIENLTLQLITGYIFVPIAWLIGADNKDLVLVGRLMATKIWANEFVAYELMTGDYKGLLSARSELVAVYALCGFANLGSVGMQVGVLSTLAPTRSGDISSLAISAVLCGSLSTWISASLAGMLI